MLMHKLDLMAIFTQINSADTIKENRDPIQVRSKVIQKLCQPFKLCCDTGEYLASNVWQKRIIYFLTIIFELPEIQSP